MLRLLFVFNIYSMRNNPFFNYIWLLIIGYGCMSALCLPFLGISAATVYSGYGILILWILYTSFLVYKKRNNVIQINNYILIGAAVGITIAFVLLFHVPYLQPIITQYFIDNKSEIWSLSLIVHSKG